MSWDELLEYWNDLDLPGWFTLLAYFAFAMTGALAGLRRGYDLIGVSVLAMITAGGGGLLRDGMLINKGPPALLTDPRYLIAVLAAILATLLFHRLVDRLAKTIAVIDALGLGAFAVQGVRLSLEARLSFPGAVVGGAITAVGGGLLRDILVREEPLLFKPGQFYALIAIGACVVYLVLARSHEVTDAQAGMITVVGTFVLRMLTIRFNWRTTALYHERPPPAA